MVTDNLCFVIDGDTVKLDDIIQSVDSQQWWRATGKSVRFYCSDSFKTFYQVTIQDINNHIYLYSR
jgi:hypothetical protein